MEATLFDGFPPPPAPPRVRLRERRHPCGLFIRKVKGQKYQVRWWLPGYGSVNCGLYDEPEAEMVRTRLASETAKHRPTPLGIWHALGAVLARLRKERPHCSWRLPPPMWVRLHDDGWISRVTIRGVRVELGPFSGPEEAHLAMMDHLGRGDSQPVAVGLLRSWLTLADVGGWAS